MHMELVGDVNEIKEKNLKENDRRMRKEVEVDQLNQLKRIIIFNVRKMLKTHMI